MKKIKNKEIKCLQVTGVPVADFSKVKWDGANNTFALENTDH